MYVRILYHPDSEHERKVLSFKRDFEMQTDREIDLVSLETREGAETAELYDIQTYPAVLASSDDGQLLKLWQQEELPLINEVSYYAREHQVSSADVKTETIIKPPTHKTVKPAAKTTKKPAAKPATKTTKKPAAKKAAHPKSKTKK